MLVNIERHMIENTIIPMIENGTASRVDMACFRDGDESEFVVEFFRLWGRIVRTVYNRRSTCSTYQFVCGKDVEMFDYHYPINRLDFSI